MALIQFYYGFFYTTGGAFPAVHHELNNWGGVALVVAYLVAVFFCRTKQCKIRSDSDGRGSGVPLVIGLHIVHYMIMCMINYIEWTEKGVSGLAFGLGTFISIALIVIIQLRKGRSALYIWLMFLVLSLLGLGVLLYDTPVTFISGSFTYGLGNSLGYIIICYMCAGAIKLSKSLRMFKLCCLAFFTQYFIISGVFSFYFNHFETPDKFLAFGVVLVLVCLCLLFLPLLQKRLFDADWTDGLYLRDMEEYSKPLLETEESSAREHLNLTPREKEIFTMLLDGIAPKEIAFTLKINYETVHFHQKNLYRKLGIQSRAELFARYLAKTST
jgi:DNA-binding CsgD family transcriptional regulator